MKITRRGTEMNTSGNLPETNTMAPSLQNLVKGDGSWNHFDPATVSGKYLVLNIFPSIDTPTCATTVREFNKQIASLENTHVLCISKDLPPALSRFCAAEGIQNVTPVSAYRTDCSFGRDYGIEIVDGAGENSAFKNLFGRAVVIIDPTGKVMHNELVTELANQPNYDVCLAKIKQHQQSQSSSAKMSGQKRQEPELDGARCTL